MLCLDKIPFLPRGNANNPLPFIIIFYSTLTFFVIIYLTYIYILLIYRIYYSLIGFTFLYIFINIYSYLSIKKVKELTFNF